ncbi:hypothetical protein [Metabacillus endolithicus]|uniref:Uncharacterized protein n=1 Tax=Metabacillus endolithicus TaxID=1535204 RepID=A0ABW5BYM4_9BACI|nr:hypothetical protein [Metabacillus endolithicus]UPG64735.1 hypothetical protein MVE64_06675 [Metabacillus endolithicus]
MKMNKTLLLGMIFVIVVVLCLMNGVITVHISAVQLQKVLNFVLEVLCAALFAQLIRPKENDNLSRP